MLETHKAPNKYVNKSALHNAIFFNLDWFKNNGSNKNVNKNCINDVAITPLLKKAAGLQKGSPTPHTNKVAKVTKDQLAEIVKTKEGDLTGANLENSIKIIAGTARSMGIEVEE